MLDPVQRRKYGVTGIVLSVVFLSVSVAAGVGNAIRRDTVIEEINASMQECENRLRTLGATNVSVADDKIVVDWNDLSGGYSLLGDTSAAAMACPGWQMRSFCMGQECEIAGVRLELGKTR